MVSEMTSKSLTKRRRSVFGLITELLSIHRPMELQTWTPEDVIAEVERDVGDVR